MFFFFLNLFYYSDLITKGSTLRGPFGIWLYTREDNAHAQKLQRARAQINVSADSLAQSLYRKQIVLGSPL